MDGLVFAALLIAGLRTEPPAEEGGRAQLNCGAMFTLMAYRDDGRGPAARIRRTDPALPGKPRRIPQRRAYSCFRLANG